MEEDVFPSNSRAMHPKNGNAHHAEEVAAPAGCSVPHYYSSTCAHSASPGLSLCPSQGGGGSEGGSLSCVHSLTHVSCCSLPLPRGIFRGLGTLVQRGGPGRCYPFPRRSGQRGGALSACDGKVHFRVTDPQFGGPSDPMTTLIPEPLNVTRRQQADTRGRRFNVLQPGIHKGGRRRRGRLGI